MKMKNIIVVLVLGVLFSSCEKWLDINTSPNTASAESVDPDYIFGYATAAFSGNRSGGDGHMPIGFMNQTISTGGNFGWGYGEDRYQISPYSEGNSWRTYFVNVGQNLKNAINVAESRDPIENNIAAQCKVLFAGQMYECTTIWGDIPYSEAWSDVEAPKFDAQEDVLNSLISTLDEAIAQFDTNDPIVISANDVYYQGDISQWLKLANSLKLKIAMLMVDKDASKTSLITSLISDDNFIASSADNWKFPFYNVPGSMNPKFGVMNQYSGGQNLWFFASSVLTDMMIPVNDPRLPIYFDEGPDAADGQFIGVDPATEADDFSSLISPATLWFAEGEDLIYSYQELLFFKAEIYARGLGVPADLTIANTYFQQAVAEALRYYDVAESDITTFLAQPGFDLTALSSADAIRAIHTQQYVDLMDRSQEAWTQMRRSGDAGSEVPLLDLPEGAPAGGIARRWNYPVDELNGNSNAPSTTPFMYESLWFDK